MRHPIWFLSISLVFSFSIVLRAESVQDRGLPGAVAFEAVFPHIVSGSLGDIQYQSDLVIINSEDQKALVELDFYFESGQTANDLLDDGGADWSTSYPWARMENLARSVENGRFYVEVAGHTVLRLEFPGRLTSLVGQEFSAWAKLRSNVMVSAFEEIRVIDERGLQVRADVTTSIAAARQAELSVMTSKCPWHTGDPVFENAPQGGWVIGTYGISLVNPGNSPAEIEVELDAHKKTLSLAPYSKQASLLEEIADSFVPANCVKGGTLTARSLNGVPFAVLGIKVKMWVDLNFGPAPRVDQPWITFQSGGQTRLSPQERFNWPEEILVEAQLGGTNILLTRFGFITKDSQGKTAVHPLNVGPYRTQDVGIAVDGQLGVGAIWYSGNYGPMPILFKNSGRVLYVEAIGGPSSIKAVADQPGKVEIRTGHPCFRTIIIVDTVKEEIVSVESTRDEGAFCL